MNRSDNSVRSPSSDLERSKRRPPTWDGSPATDFAITTINVPDRLDVQEVRARQEDDGYPRRSWFSVDRHTVSVWFRRLFSLAVVGGLGWLAWNAMAPLINEVSKESIAARLSAAVGVPVAIADRSFSVWPQPRMVLRGVDVGGKLRADEVALQLSWDELVRAAKLGRVSIGEAVIGPIRLDATQSADLVNLGPRLANAAGFSVSTLRFSSVEFPDFALLPHQYQIVIRRGPLNSVAPIEVSQLGGDGQMLLRISASTDAGVPFELEAERWRAPVGPGVVWTSLAATGHVLPQAVVVDSYTAAAPFGVFQGALVAASDTAWSVAGTTRSLSIDLESLMRRLAGARDDDTAAPKSPLIGTASVNLIGGGHGPSLNDALFVARVGGPVSVRFGTLNGINLGLAATQGGSAETSGGITRFTELNALIEAGDGGLNMRDIVGRAGAMATRGQVSVGPDLKLSGTVRVDLGAERVQAPTTLRVSGTATSPRFGRN
jgi:hypothetical protein